jgi:hypothetical protein
MIYIKYITSRNNSIIEVSGEPFDDFLQNESGATTNYDFPTGQKLFFYRWNGSDVEVNDEDTIRSFYEEEGGLTGLDLEPHIENVVGADFIPDSTKEITITGVNFSPFSIVEVSGEGNFVNTMYFDTPKQIRASITVDGDEGTFNLVVRNDQLHSHDSGYNAIVVKSKTAVDLRTTPIGLLGLEMTSGINVEQDVEKGLRFYSSISSWNRGVKFSNFTWNRSDEITFEIIFTRISDNNFMVGIGSADLNVSSISSAYYKQEIGMYHNNNKLTSVYGGGDVNNWSQGVGSTIIFDLDKFYKFKLENSGGNGGRCSIWEVDPDDWDDETEIHSWISSCPADDLILLPFVIPQAASGEYYITGFRF